MYTFISYIWLMGKFETGTFKNFKKKNETGLNGIITCLIGTI